MKNGGGVVVSAFAAGDLATLRSLLSSHLYGEFGRTISERPKGQSQVEPIRFAGPVEAEIVNAGMSGRRDRHHAASAWPVRIGPR